MKRIFLFLIMLVIPLNVYGINLDTSSLVAIDTNSNRIFFAKNKDDERLIASTTKIMTAILAIESNKLEHVVTVGDEVLTMYGSNIYIEMGEEIILLDLLYGLMMRSGNDAATTIATFVGGTYDNFIKMMNDKAKSLGMYHTTFNNPHGLDDDTKNYSTAYDMSLLLSYASKIPLYNQISGMKAYKTSSSIKSYSWSNRCDLLFSYNSLISCKTGYTPDAGRLLATTATKDDLNIAIYSINNNYYDYELHKNIYEEIFNNYKNYTLIDKDKLNINSKLNGSLYVKKDFTYPLTDEEYKNIDMKIDIEKKSNYKDSDKVGSVYIYLENEIITKQDLYIRVKKESLFERMKKLFANIF